MASLRFIAAPPFFFQFSSKVLELQDVFQEIKRGKYIGLCDCEDMQLQCASLLLKRRILHDIFCLRKILISHPHLDHIGGLTNLVWNIRKMHWVKGTKTETDIDIWLPDLLVWDAVMALMRCSEGTYALESHLYPNQIRDGMLFDDGVLRVTAAHNLHVAPLQEQWRSFSFLIEAEGKRLVYSGDIKNYSELDPLIGDGCDGLIIETGHFSIDEVYAYTRDKKIGKLYFTHNGREILNHPEESRQKVRRYFGQSAVICFDGMIENL